MAGLLYTNEMYLHHTLRRYYGCPFSVYIARLRMQYAIQMLDDPAYGQLSITDIALDAGFGSRFTFYRQFKAQTGIAPLEYRRKANQTYKP